MGSMFRIIGAAVAPLLLLACASSGVREREEASLARYEAVAGAPVDSFRFFRMDRYVSLGSDHIAVWTSTREAWLVEVQGPCPELPYAHGIGLSSSLGKVYARFDEVIVGRERCRIGSIRPIDAQALRESERAARSGTVEGRERSAEG